MFLCDTNVVSELRKARSGRAEPCVVAWADRVNSHDLYLSVISVLELEMGVLQVRRRDEAQGRILRNWLNHRVMPTFAERTLPITIAIARQCAQLHVPDPQSERDALIAATALVHNLTLVTRNTRDFEASDVAMINPWSFAD